MFCCPCNPDFPHPASPSFGPVMASVITPRASSWTLGFLCPMRLLRALAASFGETCLDRIWSQISKFNAKSSFPAGVFSDVALSTDTIQKPSWLVSFVRKRSMQRRPPPSPSLLRVRLLGRPLVQCQVSSCHERVDDGRCSASFLPTSSSMAEVLQSQDIV